MNYKTLACCPAITSIDLTCYGNSCSSRALRLKVEAPGDELLLCICVISIYIGSPCFHFLKRGINSQCFSSSKTLPFFFHSTSLKCYMNAFGNSFPIKHLLN